MIGQPITDQTWAGIRTEFTLPTLQQVRTAAARELARWLQPPRSTHPWPATVKGITPDRFNRDKDPVALTLVEPLAVEVSADSAWSGRSFRHPLRFLRARPELSPADIVLPEMLRPLGRAPANTAEL